MTRKSEQYHILEERDGEYFNRVVCKSHDEALEMLKEVSGNFLIVPSSEVDDYLFTQNGSDDYTF